VWPDFAPTNLALALLSLLGLVFAALCPVMISIVGWRAFFSTPETYVAITAVLGISVVFAHGVRIAIRRAAPVWRAYRRSGDWPGWKEFFAEKRPEYSTRLAPDLFVGYYRTWEDTLSIIIDGVAYWNALRKRRRAVRKLRRIDPAIMDRAHANLEEFRAELRSTIDNVVR
jgi:hypothetical protein